MGKKYSLKGTLVEVSDEIYTYLKIEVFRSGMKW